MNRVIDILEHASFAISILGAAVIVLGVGLGLIRFLRSEMMTLRGIEAAEDRTRLRHAMAYYLLLGLEFLIAADIIGTLLQPGIYELIVLGSVVLIRTVISYSLNTELKPANISKPAES